MKKCEECGNEISTTAKTCPKCGATVKVPIDPDAIKGLLLLAGIVIAWVAIASSCSDDPEPAKAPAKVEAKEAAVEPSPECKPDDLQCNGDNGSISAGIYCPDEIEKLAKFSVKWTDGWLETKFSHFRWKNKEKGEITYIGDKAQFQNGFGAYASVVYECDMAADAKTIIDVRVREGRL